MDEMNRTRDDDEEEGGHLKFSQVKEPAAAATERRPTRKGKGRRGRAGGGGLCWEGRKWVEGRKKEEEDSQLRLTWNQVANHKGGCKNFLLGTRRVLRYLEVKLRTRRIWLDKGGARARGKSSLEDSAQVGKREEPGMLRGSRFE